MFGESPVIAPKIAKDPLLEIIAHVGAALIQADPTDDPIIIGHVRSAHELTVGLRRLAAREAALNETNHATF